MNCTQCGAQIADNAGFCSYCGAQKAQPQGFDPNQQNQNQAQYQNPYQQPPQPGVLVGYPQKSKLAAGLLQLLLGVGIGRFYLGYTGIGVAQLLVTIFTCGAGALWPFIDGIMILTGSVKTDAKGVPLKD